MLAAPSHMNQARSALSSSSSSAFSNGHHQTLPHPSTRPSRPARSPLVAPSPPPSTSTRTLSRPTSRTALIPGLGFHLSQNKRSSSPLPPNLAGLASPESVYSSPESGGPPTVSDRPEPDDSEAGNAWVGDEDEQTREEWTVGDNYTSPVWASRWDRRGSGASEMSYGGSEGGLVLPQSQSNPMFSRRPSSLSSDPASSQRRRSSGGSLKASLAAYPFRPSSSSKLNHRRGSQVSIVLTDDDDGQSYSLDGWGDQSEDSRRDSYDSAFAFDAVSRTLGGGGGMSDGDAKSARSSQDLTFGSLPYSLRKPASFHPSSSSSLNLLAGGPPSSIINRKRSTDLRRVSVERRASIEQRGFQIPVSGWDGQRRISVVSSVESVGERERVRRLGGLGSLNRRESEVLEVQGRGGRYGLGEQRDLWNEGRGESRWSPSTAGSPISDAASSPEAEEHQILTTVVPRPAALSRTFSFRPAADVPTLVHPPLDPYTEDSLARGDVSPRTMSSPLPPPTQTLSNSASTLNLRRGAVSVAPYPQPEAIENLSPPQLIAAFSDDSASDSNSSDLDEVSSADEEGGEDEEGDVEFGHVERILVPLQARQMARQEASPVEQGLADRVERMLVSSRAASPVSELAYLAGEIRIRTSSELEKRDREEEDEVSDTYAHYERYTLYDDALSTPSPSSYATVPMKTARPRLLQSQSVPVVPLSSISLASSSSSHGPRHYDRMAAFRGSPSVSPVLAPAPPTSVASPASPTLSNASSSFLVRHSLDYPLPSSSLTHLYASPPANYPPSSPDSTRAPGQERDAKSRRMSRLSGRSGGSRQAGRSAWDDVPWGKRASIASSSDSSSKADKDLAAEQERQRVEALEIEREKEKEKTRARSRPSYGSRQNSHMSIATVKMGSPLPFEDEFVQRVQKEDEAIALKRSQRREEIRVLRRQTSSASSSTSVPPPAPSSSMARGPSSSAGLKPILSRPPLFPHASHVLSASSPSKPYPSPPRSMPMSRAQSSAVVPSSRIRFSTISPPTLIASSSPLAPLPLPGPSAPPMVRGDSSSSTRLANGKGLGRSAVFSRLFVHRKANSTSFMP